MRKTGHKSHTHTPYRRAAKFVSKGEFSGRAYAFYFDLWCKAHCLILAYVPRASPTLPVLPSRTASDLLNQYETDELSKPVSLYTNLPTPELIDASRPAPSYTRKSAYDHPALQPDIDEDGEWSTLPQRKPRSRALSSNLTTTSAKFRLPIHSRDLSPTTEDHEERTGKRPRITLYRPPPRTVTVDLDSLEGRYALVRSTMRKVRTLVTTDPSVSISVCMVTGADVSVLAVAPLCV